MGTKDWTEDEIKEFSIKLYKALTEVHLARVKFKSTNEELQKLSECQDIKMPIDNLRTNCLLFQRSAIKMMGRRIRAKNSWRNYWGAPQWILDLEPSFGIVERALQVERLSLSEPGAGPDPLERLLGDLTQAAANAAVTTTSSGRRDVGEGMMRHLRVARLLARYTAVPERCHHAAWYRLYGEATSRARALWAAGDGAAGAGEGAAGAGDARGVRLTATHWKVVDLALYYGAEPAHVTQESLADEEKAEALRALLELVAEACGEEEAEGAREARELRVTTEPGRYNLTIEPTPRAAAVGSKGINISKQPGQYNLTIEPGDGERGLLRLDAEAERALWAHVHAAYTRSGRRASALTLQWRWLGLRQQAALLAAGAAPPHPLLYAVLLRFPWAGEETPPSWRQLRLAGRLHFLPHLQADGELPSELEVESDMYYFRDILETADAGSECELERVYSSSEHELKRIDIGSHIDLKTQDTVAASPPAYPLAPAPTTLVSLSASPRAAPTPASLTASAPPALPAPEPPAPALLAPESPAPPTLPVPAPPALLMPAPALPALPAPESPALPAPESPAPTPPALPAPATPAPPAPAPPTPAPPAPVPPALPAPAPPAPESPAPTPPALPTPAPPAPESPAPPAPESPAPTPPALPTPAPPAPESPAPTPPALPTPATPAPPAPTPPAPTILKHLLLQKRTEFKDRENLTSSNRKTVAYDEKLTRDVVVVVTRLEQAAVPARRAHVPPVESARTPPAESAPARPTEPVRPVRSARLKRLGHRSALPSRFWKIKNNMRLLNTLKPVHVMLERLPFPVSPRSPTPTPPRSPPRSPTPTPPQLLIPRPPAAIHCKKEEPPPAPPPAPAMPDVLATDSSECATAPPPPPPAPRASAAPARRNIEPRAPDAGGGAISKKKKKLSKKSNSSGKTKSSSPLHRRHIRKPLPQWEWAEPALSPHEEWERQKNIMARYFSLPACPLRPTPPLPPAGRARPIRPVSDIYRSMKTDPDAPIIISDEDEPPPSSPAAPPATSPDEVARLTPKGSSNGDSAALVYVDDVETPLPVPDSSDTFDPELPMPVIASVTSLAPTAGARDGEGGGAHGKEAPLASGAGGGALCVVAEAPPGDAGGGAGGPSSIALSLHRSISVAEYLAQTLSPHNPVFRLDAAAPLWTLLDDFIIVTTDFLPVATPTYWAGAGGTRLPSCARLLLPPEPPGPHPELLVCECAAAAKCDLCTCVAVLAGTRGPSPAHPAAVPVPGAAPAAASAKIQVKAFAKMASDDDATDAPPVIRGGGETFARTCVAPLTYESVGSRGAGDLRVVNKALQRRLCGELWVPVLTSVNSAAAARRLARAGRPLRCSPFRTFALAPPRLFAELQRVLSEPDPPDPPTPLAPPCLSR